MAVLVHKIVEDESGKRHEMVYRSTKYPLTNNDIQQAEKLDAFLSARFKEIRKRLKADGLINHKKGDLERWYALGSYISEFVDDPSIVPPEDRVQDRFIWEAFWFHAPDGVSPGDPNSNTGTARDHFRLCYQLAKIPYDIASQFSWSDWVNFLETPAAMSDDRIAEWLRSRIAGTERDTLRAFTRIIRKQFRIRDLSVLEDYELESELEHAWGESVSEVSSKK